ncbi:CAT RNA binding domain-containing protein [Ruminococcus sp.]
MKIKKILNNNVVIAKDDNGCKSAGKY